MTIAIGCDHAGFAYKNPIIEHLQAKKYDVLDFGTFDTPSVDYPDFAHPTAEAVESGKAKVGVLICGSGNGVNITANKHQGIRAALCWETEIAELARTAFRAFGKGRHKAGLNFGDCFSYALAKIKDWPLLAKGDNFRHTDVTLAI